MDFCSDIDENGHCITCSDEGVSMKVVQLRDRDIALVEDVSGSHVEVMTDLVGAVAPGDELLVHAGVALTRLHDSSEAREDTNLIERAR